VGSFVIVQVDLFYLCLLFIHVIYLFHYFCAYFACPFSVLFYTLNLLDPDYILQPRLNGSDWSSE